MKVVDTWGHLWYYNTCKEQENKVDIEKEINMGSKKFKTNEEFKNFLFDVWEDLVEVTINDMIFKTVTSVLAYDYYSETFETYFYTDKNFELPVVTFSLSNVKTVNDIKIMIEENVVQDINEIIN